MLLIINEDFGYVAEPNFCLKFSLFVKIKKKSILHIILHPEALDILKHYMTSFLYALLYSLTCDGRGRTDDNEDEVPRCLES